MKTHTGPEAKLDRSPSQQQTQEREKIKEKKKKKERTHPNSNIPIRTPSDAIIMYDA
jgi:hypothetical protein